MFLLIRLLASILYGSEAVEDFEKKPKIRPARRKSERRRRR